MKTIALAICLGALLTGAAVFALDVWLRHNDVSISPHGMLAMALGVVFSLGLGMGLMWLVFKSSRSGMDR